VSKCCKGVCSAKNGRTWVDHSGAHVIDRPIPCLVPRRESRLRRIRLVWPSVLRPTQTLPLDLCHSPYRFLTSYRRHSLQMSISQSFVRAFDIAGVNNARHEHGPD